MRRARPKTIDPDARIVMCSFVHRNVRQVVG
jgi:hypothetical protein